jgi:hypothetical protein
MHKGGLPRDWFNEFYGAKLDEGLDPAFTYEAAQAARVNTVSVAESVVATVPLTVSAEQSPAGETALAANIPTSSQGVETVETVSAATPATTDDGTAESKS